MKEPVYGEYANCCMIVQDFKHDEIDGLVEGDEKALFKEVWLVSPAQM